MRRGIAALVLLLGIGGQAFSQADIVGRASVIDGDTIEVHGERTAAVIPDRDIWRAARVARRSLLNVERSNNG